MIQLLLFAFAFVLFIIAGLGGISDPWHNRLTCLGLACLTLALALPTFGMK